MPELPEVETAKRGIENAILRKTIQNVEILRYDLRVPVPQDTKHKLEGRVCESLTRRGKYIILNFTGGVSAILHLGMSGRVRIYASDQAFMRQKHDHIILTMNDGTQIIYHDPRRFGFFYSTDSALWRSEKPFQKLGPEPLEDWSAEHLWHSLQGRTMPIKAALLDQSIVSGLGNIYVCEALHCASISPVRLAKSLSKAECAKLFTCCRAVLEKAIAAGGSTLRDYQQTDGSLGYFQYQFSVYDREGKQCPRQRCKGTISRIIQSGRSTFSCPICQK